MAGPPNAAAAQLTMVFSGNACPTGAVCTLGIAKDDGDFSQADVDDLVEAIVPVHKQLSVSTCTLSRLELKVGPSSVGPTYIAPVGEQGAGLSPGVAANTATLLRKQVDGVSGRYSGRMFWPAPPEDRVDQAGNIAIAFRVDGQPKLDDFTEWLLDHGYWPAVYSGGATGELVLRVNRLVIQDVAATQRRRMRR